MRAEGLQDSSRGLEVGQVSGRQDTAEIRKAVLEAADELLSAYPSTPEACAARALAQTRFGATAEAEANWKQCLQLDRQFVDAYEALGSIFLDRGDYELAEQYYRDALRLAPARDDVQHRLAETLVGSSKMDQAIALLQERVKAGSASAETYFWLGQACLQSKDFEKAAEYHQASIRLDPGNTYSYYGLATASMRLGEKEKAQAFLDDFRRLKARDQQAELDRMAKVNDVETVARSAAFLWSVLAEVHARHGDTTRAVQSWRNAWTLRPDDVSSREKAVALLSRQQRFPEAITVMEEICRIYPANSRALVALGVLHAQSGDFDASERTFLDAIIAEPNRADGHAALARLYVQANRNPAAALTHARKAVELAPIAGHFMILAEAEQKNGNLVATRSAVKRAMELAPDNATYRTMYESMEGSNSP